MKYIRDVQTFEQLFVMMRTSSRLTLVDVVHCLRTAAVSNVRPNSCRVWIALLAMPSFEIIVVVHDVALRMVLIGLRKLKVNITFCMTVTS